MVNLYMASNITSNKTSIIQVIADYWKNNFFSVLNCFNEQEELLRS